MELEVWGQVEFVGSNPGFKPFSVKRDYFYIYFNVSICPFSLGLCTWCEGELKFDWCDYGLVLIKLELIFESSSARFPPTGQTHELWLAGDAKGEKDKD